MYFLKSPKVLAILGFLFSDATWAKPNYAMRGTRCPGLTCEGIIRDSLLGFHVERGPALVEAQKDVLTAEDWPRDDRHPRGYLSPGAHIIGGHHVAPSGEFNIIRTMRGALLTQKAMLIAIACVALVLVWKILSYLLKGCLGQAPKRFEDADSGFEEEGEQQSLSLTSRDADAWSPSPPELPSGQEFSEDVKSYGVAGLLLRSLVICLPCVGAGYNLTIIGASLPSLAMTYGLDAAMEGVVVSSYCGGCIIGALLTSRLSNEFGRKAILMLSSATLLLAQLIMMVAMNLWIFLVGRSLVGVSAGLAFTLAPMYIAELVPRAHRGFFVSMLEQASSMGLLFGFASASMQEVSFRHHAIVGASIPVVALVLLPLVAESPRWLIGQKRFEEAKIIMQKYVSDREEVTQSLEACKSFTCQKANEDLTIAVVFDALFGSPAGRRRLAMACVIMALEQCVGVETSDAFCIQFLIEGGISQSVIEMLLCGMVLAKGGVLLASGIFLDSFGRKPALCFSFGGIFLALLGSSWAFGAGNSGMLALMWLLFNLMYAAGLGNVCPVLCSESFPDQRTRGIGIAFLYVFNRCFGALVTGMYPVLHDVVGVSHIFLLWAAAACVGLIFTYFCMVETRGRVLENC